MPPSTKKLVFAAALGLLAVFTDAGTARADDTLRRVQQSLRDQGFYYGAIDGAPGDETTHAIRRYQIRNGLAVTGELNDETTRSIDRNEASATKGNASGSRITGNNNPGADEDRRYAQGNDAPAPSRATPAPAASRPDMDGEVDDSADDAPASRAPVNRPDLRVAPSTNDAAPAPRNGIPPSAALTGVFERTPYEFAPPPVQSDVLRRAQTILLRDGFYDGEANGRPNPVTFEALTNFQGVNHLRRTGRLDVETLAAMRLMPGGRPPVGPRGPGGVYEGRVTQ